MLARRGLRRFCPMAFSRHIDRIAIVLSTVCIVHCLAMPFVIASGLVAALTLGGDAHFHELMLWLVVPTSVAGFALGYRLHRETRIVAIGAAAVAVLALAALWGHDAWGRTFETAANVAASLVLAYAHWRNFREVRRVHRHG
jgi:hypothetical protein